MFGEEERARATQAVALPGPLAMVAVSCAPGAAVAVLAVMVGVVSAAEGAGEGVGAGTGVVFGPLASVSVIGSLLARRVYAVLGKSRNSEAPAPCGMGKGVGGG